VVTEPPPSWIRHLGFLNFCKTSKTAKNDAKVIKIDFLKMLKSLKNVNIWKNHGCLNMVAMETSSSENNDMSYQIVPR